MTLKPAFAAALLAFFAAACQPAEKTASAPAGGNAISAEPAQQAAPGASRLATFKIGDFDKLDFSQKLSLPTSPFVDASGKEHTFADFKGKVVVYNLWAEWCAPCVEEMPTLAGLQKAFQGKDVVVVPVAAGYPNARDSALAKFKTLAGATLPFFYDEKYNVNSDAQTGAFPSTIIYDKSGKEVARMAFPAKWDSPAAIALVQAVLDGKG
jgi:thiol-disulfide isomerase/thioredoxin